LAAGSAVIVLAATNRLDSVDEALRRPGRFDREIEVTVPGPSERLDILQKMLSTMHHCLSDAEVCAGSGAYEMIGSQELSCGFICYPPGLLCLQVVDTAMAAHGFVGADLSALCGEAALAALRRITTSGASRSICLQDIAKAQTVVRPSAMREVALEVPKVR
jgi:AAA family ATPase